jgi:ankyrin repeat protein
MMGLFLHVKQDGRTALMYACHHGHIATAAMLLENKTNIDAVDNVSAWCGMLCLMYPRPSSLSNLSRCKDGLTALMCACQNGHTATATMLLENKANIDAVDGVRQ